MDIGSRVEAIGWESASVDGLVDVLTAEVHLSFGDVPETADRRSGALYRQIRVHVRYRQSTAGERISVTDHDTRRSHADENKRGDTHLHTYTGHTLLLYNDMYYREIDECSFMIKKHGYVKDRFVPLPEAIDSAFRYTDGKIYFFKDGRVYVYDEFLNTIAKGKHTDGLSVVGIKCIDSTIVSKLIDLLREYV